MSTLFMVVAVVCPIEMSVTTTEVNLADQEWPDGCYQIVSEETYGSDFACMTQAQIFVMQAGHNVHGQDGRLITPTKIRAGHKVIKYGCLQEKRIRFNDVEI